MKYEAKQALIFLNQARKRYADFEQAKVDWYRDPDTRRLKFPECIHGTSTWTDYDNICGPCENGEGYWDYVREAEWAIIRAKTALAQVDHRLHILCEIPIHLQTPELKQWVKEPIA